MKKVFEFSGAAKGKKKEILKIEEKKEHKLGTIWVCEMKKVFACIDGCVHI